jgi:hypothetical protein
LYIRTASPNCRALLLHEEVRAFSLAWAKTGKRIAARIAIIAMTTSNSIRVNPSFRRRHFFVDNTFFLLDDDVLLASGQPWRLIRLPDPALLLHSREPRPTMDRQNP